MGKISRTRGANFERRIAARLRKQWPDATVRRSQQAHRAYESDIVVEGDAPKMACMIWWELTDAAQPNPPVKFVQAQHDLDALGNKRRIPIVVWHKKRALGIHVTTSIGWFDFIRGLYQVDGPRNDTALVTIDLDDFLRMVA